MKGKHSIVVRNRRVQFALELERNITVIRGDSATGKTTMLGMLRDYEELGAQSGVAVQCDKPCRTLTSRDWESQLSRMKDSIVFVDEGNAFVSSRAFAQAICGSSNYYVLITRESLYQLPYSVEAVLELRTTTRREKCTYNKAYPYYGTLEHAASEMDRSDRILTEDSNSGYQIYIVAKIFDQQGCIAYRCKTLNEARCVPGTLEALRADGVQIVILDSPEIYSEYAPYTYIEDLKEFIDKVAQMNRVAPVFRKH